MTRNAGRERVDAHRQPGSGGAQRIPERLAGVDNDPRAVDDGGEAEMQLVLYVRRKCHLCTEMHRELLDAGARHAFSVELVDIETDAELVTRYGHKVPVLVGGGEEICHYFLDEHELDEFLSRTP